MPAPNRARDVFFAALDLPEPDRETFIDSACGTDLDLRRRVAALLAAHALPDPVLDRPAAEHVLDEPPPEPGPPAPPGYILAEEVGRGGMGVVYRARDERLGRDVAVKLLRAGVPAGSPLAVRFLDEASVTARLQHPGIPAVHQVGELPDGRPFLAMKLVAGRTLAAMLDDPAVAADRGRLLSVFETVCQAVGYAHSRGVIHRDLKPANVMVGEFGEVQVMDWGLARGVRNAEVGMRNEQDPLASAEFSSTPLSGFPVPHLTHAGAVMGTPGFMAPEQARGESVDRRADVFGLGAVLCVLLTGRPPFRDSALERTAAGDLTQARDALAACVAEPELVALCERCLNPDPDGRPADAGAVAAAVAEFRGVAERRARQAELDRTRAEANTAAERRRRRVVLVAGTLLLTVVSVGASVAAWLAIRATKAEAETALQLDLTQQAESAAKTEAANARAAEGQARAAEGQARAAEGRARAAATDAREAESNAREEAADTEAFSKFLVKDVLAAARPKGVQGGLGIDVKMVDALRQADRDIATAFAGRPKAEATARHAFGATWRTLGRADAAVPHLKKAVELRQRVLGPTHADTLDSMNSLAQSYDQLGRHADAEPLYRTALTAHRAAAGDTHESSMVVALNLANLFQQTTRFGDAETLLLDLLPKSRAARGDNDLFTLKAARDLGDVYARTNRPAKAEPLLREALTGFQTTAGPNHPDTLAAAEGLANLLRRDNRMTEVEPLYELVLSGRRKTLGDRHPSTLSAANNLGSLRIDQRRFDDAEKLLTEAVAGHRANHDTPQPGTMAAVTNLAVLRVHQGRTADAIPLYQEAADGYRAIHRDGNPITVQAVRNLAEANFDLNRWKVAAPLFDEVYQNSKGLTAGQKGELQVRLGLSLAGAGKPDEALPHLLDAFEYLTELPSLSAFGVNKLRRVTQALADACQRLGHPDKAAGWRAILAKLPSEVAPPPRPAR